jgi:hypothetical protein
MRYCNPQMMQQISVVPTGAWAFCRLTLNNSQAIFRIRRASDNAELNIYSPSPAAIAAFCGASNGFVRSVFDQSGNGRHYDQTTNAQQLKIFDSATGTVLNLATGTTVGMLGDGSTTNMTGADSAGLTGNPAMTVSDLHEDTDATLNLGLYFFGKHQNAVGSDGYYAALPAGSVSNLTERLFGSVSLGTIFDVRFSGLITGLQSWVAHKPNAGTDTNFALTRNGVNLTQTSSTGLALNILPFERLWGALRSLAGGIGNVWKGNLFNLLVWGTTELTGADLANLESWQSARRTS